MIKIFNKNNRNEWSEKLLAVSIDANRSSHPQVNCYCLYGEDVSTDYSYVFENDILDSKFITSLQTNGDGNQDIWDNTFCSTWKQSSGNYGLVMKGFANVHHMEMYSNEDVMSYVYDILFDLL